MAGPHILAGSAHTHTDLWSHVQFPTGIQKGLKAPAQLVQESGQPRFQGTCTLSFSDVSLTRYIQIFPAPNFDSGTHKFVILYIAPISIACLHHPWTRERSLLCKIAQFVIAERFKQAELLRGVVHPVVLRLQWACKSPETLKWPHSVWAGLRGGNQCIHL